MAEETEVTIGKVDENDPTWRPPEEGLTPGNEDATLPPSPNPLPEPDPAQMDLREPVAYVIRAFDASSGVVEVDYADGLSNRFHLPKKNGRYVTGAELDAWIQHMRPWPEEPGENADEILNLVEPRPVDILEYARNKRWEVETGGIVVNGVPIDTDDRSKLMVAGARLRAEADPNVIENWAAADGSTVPLTAAEIIAISDAIGAHVSECFRIYAELKARIDAGEAITTQDVDAAFAVL